MSLCNCMSHWENKVINLSCQYNKINWSDRGEMHSWSKKPPKNCNFWRKKDCGNAFGVDCRKFCKGYCHEFSHRDSNYPKYPNKQEFYVGWLHCIEFTWFVTQVCSSISLKLFSEYWVQLIVMYSTFWHCILGKKFWASSIFFFIASSAASVVSTFETWWYYIVSVGQSAVQNKFWPIPKIIGSPSNLFTLSNIFATTHQKWFIGFKKQNVRWFLSFLARGNTMLWCGRGGWGHWRDTIMVDPAGLVLLVTAGLGINLQTQCS